ncbi:MAG: GDP-mannose 4,6-dehydratase [Rhodospirillales bacterium]
MAFAVCAVAQMVDTFWRDRPTLVTGASGLVGSWLVKRLLEKNAQVICLVRDWVPGSELIRSGDLQRSTVVNGDVTDHEALERIIGEYEIDTVFHLAAQTIVGIANRNPLSTFESNIKGTWSLLEACRRSPTVKQIVIASSDKAYGDHETLPYDENMPLQGMHPYDVSKSCADLIATTYANTFDLPVVVTRCGNFFGGGDLNWNRIVPGTIRSILRGDAPVIRSDGKYIRDYFYVEDGADAYMLVAEKLAENRELAGEAFNFSNELQLTVLDIVDMIRTRMGSNLEPVVLNQTSNEIKHQYLSAEKARRVLGWQPTSDMESSIDRTIEWYRDHLEI